MPRLLPGSEAGAKYAVFKISDYEQLTDVATLQRRGISPTQAFRLLHGTLIDDAIVIRRQDVFAAPALYSYANSIIVAVKAIKADAGGYNEPLVERLLKIADYFMSEADKAAHENKGKLPD